MEREVEFFGAALKIRQEFGEDIGNGGQVWDSAILLLKYLENMDDFPMGHWKGKKVLEMSAGTGVASIALAHLGAAHVVATDLLPLLPLIEHNAYTLNHIPKSRLVAKELSWGNMPQCEQILKEHGPFDYILISDVIVKIYEPSYAALIATIDAVCSDATKVIMAVELRNPEDTVTFFRQLKETGRLTFSMIAEDKVEEMYRAPELALFEIRRVDATS